MTPRKNHGHHDHDLLTKYGVPILAALLGAGGGTIGATVLDWRTGRLETDVRALEALVRADHDEQVVLKTEIKLSLEQIVEEGKEARQKTIESAADVRALRGEIDKAREECRKCAR